MKWHRGLALVLAFFGTAYTCLGLWSSTGHGPAKTAFESLRRYDQALRHNARARAAALGEQTLTLAAADARWSPVEISDLAADVARTELAAGRTAKAISVSGTASSSLAQVPMEDAGLARLIDVARTRTEIALATGDGFGASCTLGILLEEVGPDRVSSTEASAHPHPELLYLAQYLTEVGPRLKETGEPAPSSAARPPLTSCELLADFYTARKDYASAAKVSGFVVGETSSGAHIAPELHAALLQRDARIHELQGDVPAAQARLEEAVTILDSSKNAEARVYALEALGTFLSNWGESGKALPVLHRALALREANDERNLPRLAPTLIALGYAELDSNDMGAAESTFKHALNVAQSPGGTSLTASVDAMHGLAELYDSQGRHDDAAKFKADAAKLQAGKAADGTPVHASENILRNEDASARALILSVPFRANGAPASGRARDAFNEPTGSGATGTVEVDVAVPVGTPWATQWDSTKFGAVSKTFQNGRVNTPSLTDEDPLRSATLLYIPGEGTTFADAAERAARLQAAAGPGVGVALSFWATAPSERGYFRDTNTTWLGVKSVTAALQALGTEKSGAPLHIVAEGRGAEVLAAALVSNALTAQIRPRLQSLALIAPGISETELLGLKSRVDAATTRVTVYGAPGARALLANLDVYKTNPAGLASLPPAALAGTEWIEIGVGDPSADWTALSTGALFSDIAAVALGAPPAGSRCGVAHVSATRAGDGFVLNPQGCQQEARAK